MLNRAAPYFAAGAVVLLLAAGIGPPRPAAADPKGHDGSTIASDYRNDPYLSDTQKRLLGQLAERSRTTLKAESWPHGGTVGRLELDVPSGAPKGASLTQHAQAFVTANAPLWKLNDTRLGVVKVTEAGVCSTVTLTLTVGASSVFNATISVVVTPSGTVRGVAGRLSGDRLGEVAPSRVTEAQAVSAVRKYVNERGGSGNDVELPRAVQVVADPYFLTDGAHKAGMSWLFSTEPGGTAQSGVFVVSGQTAQVTVAGTGVTLPNQTVVGCPGSNPTKVVVPHILDPMTRTPAVVQLGKYGVPTTGATATERAYNLLTQSYMLDLYGDRDPRRHLRDPKEVAGIGGRTIVQFQEYYAGLPVEGARLTVSLLANGRADLITARFVYFPRARTTASVAEATAVSAASARYAELECGTDAACLATLASENQAQPPKSSLTILSSEIYVDTKIPQLPPNQERLAYKIHFPRQTLFWDATDNVELYGYANKLNAIPHTIRNFEQGNQVEIVNGAPPAGVTPHPDATNLSTWFGAIDAYYLGLGRNGFDNMGGRVVAQVRANVDNAYWCLTDDLLQCGGHRMTLGSTATASDVAAHEFTHGVVEFTANFDRGGESGAMHEHYADVMASAIFPDSDPSTWLLGEDTALGAFRDMANPSAFGDPGHYANLKVNCPHAGLCTHSWAGVVNRAAVLIANGGAAGSSHPGVGRATLAKLFYSTLNSELFGESDLFLHERINTVKTCEDLVTDNTVVAGRPMTTADCDHVGRAFDTVGLAAVAEVGWTRFSSGLFGSHTDVTIREGLNLYRGCTIANHILRGEDDSGEVRTSDVAAGLSIEFAGEWGATVLARGATSDPTNRMVRYRIWTNWFSSGVVDVDELFSQPSGVSEKGCKSPRDDIHPRTLWSTERVSHWARFFDGHKGDDVINPMRSLPAGCEIDAVRGIHYHDWGTPEGAPGVTLNHEGGHGFTIIRGQAPATDLTTTVHWWHEGLTSIKVRVQYDIIEPDNIDCLTTGLQPNP